MVPWCSSLLAKVHRLIRRFTRAKNVCIEANKANTREFYLYQTIHSQANEKQSHVVLTFVFKVWKFLRMLNQFNVYELRLKLLRWPFVKRIVELFQPVFDIAFRDINHDKRNLSLKNCRCNRFNQKKQKSFILWNS